MSIRSLFVFFFFCARVPAPSRADKFGPDIRHWRRVCPRMWAVMRLMGLGLFLGGVFRGYLFFSLLIKSCSLSYLIILLTLFKRPHCLPLGLGKLRVGRVI